MSARERNQRNRSVSLRGHLTRRVLLIVGISLVLTGAPAVWFLANQLDAIGTSFERDRETLVRDVAGTHTRTQAVSVARRIDAFLLSRIIEAKAWASSPVVLDAARAGYERHVREDLPNLTVDEIEDRFLTRKSLGVSPQANAYLMRQIASSPYFAEVFFTDSNGFNVGLTNSTSDFVQSDEDWWQEAWSDFLSIGEIGYDDSAGVWSIDISVRLDDPATGELLGVMKTVLAIDSVQHIADQTVEAIPGGARDGRDERRRAHRRDRFGACTRAHDEPRGQLPGRSPCVDAHRLRLRARRPGDGRSVAQRVPPAPALRTPTRRCPRRSPASTGWPFCSSR